MITLPAELLDRPVSKPGAKHWLSGRRDSTAIQSSPSNLKQILRKIGPLPACSALIGKCFDGLPFLWDMTDPTPGSILISGGRFSGKSAILRTILASAAIMNSPGQVQFYVITPNMGSFDSVYGFPNCKGQVSTYDRASTSLVIRLSELAEQRKSGRNRGATVLLAIDDLDIMLDYHEHELKSYLKWLAVNGPYSNVWPVAAVNPANVDERDYDLLEEFGTRLSGSQEIVAYHSDSSSLGPGEFTAGVGGEYFRFSAIDAI